MRRQWLPRTPPVPGRTLGQPRAQRGSSAQDTCGQGAWEPPARAAGGREGTLQTGLPAAPEQV